MACTMLLRPTRAAETADLGEIRTILEKSGEKAKTEAMKTVLTMMANGEPCSQLVMHIMRFVMPNQKNKLLKKLVLLYFETVPKRDKDGKLLQEMILLW